MKRSLLAITMAGALSILGLLIWLTRSPKSGGEATKTPDSRSSAVLRVYRSTPGAVINAARAPVIESIHHDDTLAFAIENRDAKKYVMIFGVSDSGRVTWFYPTQRGEASDDARAIAIGRGPLLQELPDPVPRHFDGTKLAVHAVFSDEQKTTHEIEAHAIAGAAPLGIPNAVDHVASFVVGP